MKEYKLKINGKPFEVCIDSVEESLASVRVNGCEYEVELEKPAEKQVIPAAEAAATGQGTASTGAAKTPQGGNARKITAPLPGVIIEISVKEGDSVTAGQKVAILEAMKMENEIQAETSGTVTKIHVSKGDSVSDGAPIVTIA